MGKNSSVQDCVGAERSTKQSSDFSATSDIYKRERSTQEGMFEHWFWESQAPDCQPEWDAMCAQTLQSRRSSPNSKPQLNTSSGLRPTPDSQRRNQWSASGPQRVHTERIARPTTPMDDEEDYAVVSLRISIDAVQHPVYSSTESIVSCHRPLWERRNWAGTKQRGSLLDLATPRYPRLTSMGSQQGPRGQAKPE